MIATSLGDLNGVTEAAPVGRRLLGGALRLATVLVRFHDSALRIPATHQALDAPSPLLETEAAVITGAGNAAAAPAASVAAEIGSIAQFTGVA
jgi:hypothetical protein